MAALMISCDLGRKENISVLIFPKAKRMYMGWGESACGGLHVCWGPGGVN